MTAEEVARLGPGDLVRSERGSRAHRILETGVFDCPGLSLHGQPWITTLCDSGWKRLSDRLRPHDHKAPLCGSCERVRKARNQK